MGLRPASVMAPALTEGQSQSFTLPPPSSPINAAAVAAAADNESVCTTPIKARTKSTKNYNNNQNHTTGKRFRYELVSGAAMDIGENEIPTQEPRKQFRCDLGAGGDGLSVDEDGSAAQEPDVLQKDRMMVPDGDVDQLLDHFTADVEGASTSDLTANVDELMQVFKSIEASGTERAPVESEIFGGLFSEVDVISICDAEVRESRTKDLHDELEKRQAKLERRCEFLLRRLRKLQSRATGAHVSAEIAALFEHVHRTLRRVNDPSQSLHEMVRKLQLQVSVVQQAATVGRMRHSSSKYFGSGSAEHPSRGVAAAVVLPLPKEAQDEVERVAGSLQANLEMVEAALDSDATASSSGAESCDEMQSYNNETQNFLSISKRAIWRYVNDRATVASRWTWLQAQISDLEYRIRQHNDLHRQTRVSKGVICLGDSSPPRSVPSSPSAVNGYRGQLPGAISKVDEAQANGAVPCASPGASVCSRTRPLNRKVFRKRKLVQTTGLHTVSKKASRTSNIRCGCVPPQVPCALCTGRTDPTFPRDVPEQLTTQERVALLDPGFHPVLSFPDDISQSIHLEAIMKHPDWQQKILRCTPKSLKSSASRADRADKLSLTLDGKPKKPAEQRRKYTRSVSSTPGVPPKRGRKPSGGSGGKRALVRAGRKRYDKLAALAAADSVDEEMEALHLKGMGGQGNGDAASPVSHVVPFRRNRVDSYDIDNIVIPYSVAAATRVEKLQYKEILTPKWRVIDNDYPDTFDFKNGLVRRFSNDSEVEDVSDEITIARHEKSEQDERKKFLSYIKFPINSVRSRANRRTDSRAESSGGNTPDPLSPHPVDSNENTTTTSPLVTPPATPLPLVDHSDAGAGKNARRRTVSQSQVQSTPVEQVEVPPYEARVFPLTQTAHESLLSSLPEGSSVARRFQPTLNPNPDREETQAVGEPFGISTFPSPMSDSAESVAPEEDPNDPEWMDTEERVRERCKR